MQGACKESIETEPYPQPSHRQRRSHRHSTLGNVVSEDGTSVIMNLKALDKSTCYRATLWCDVDVINAESSNVVRWMRSLISLRSASAQLSMTMLLMCRRIAIGRP
ncbi:hypothetical protein BT96DRAFT_543968 [Gymnopus androsaceus JB14]|uniref:Uncharacterized protein n=1 Tax=Gymnopus androsaceus JB14 TaxID=1447944 RepID=A0A6A4HWN6_9AGAR|nr:hypothetical protein BT96DRAFT_543968 [Gymnopus androsaceus JB14]